MGFDAEALRNVMRHWVTSVTVVSAYETVDKPRGMTVSSFTSVSLDPPQILVCLHKEAVAAQAVTTSGVFGVSILAEDQAHLSIRFAGYDPDYPSEGDRFRGLKIIHAVSGAPLLAEALSWLDCRIQAIHDGSTHHIIVGEVLQTSLMSPDEQRQPLVYHNRNYHKMIPLDKT